MQRNKPYVVVRLAAFFREIGKPYLYLDHRLVIHNHKEQKLIIWYEDNYTCVQIWDIDRYFNVVYQFNCGLP